MAVQILSMVANMFSNLLAWAMALFASADMSGLFLAVIFFLMLKRYLLDPLFRDAGSDQVKKRNKE